MIHHVALETREADARGVTAFYELLGFAVVDAAADAARPRHVARARRPADPPHARR